MSNHVLPLIMERNAQPALHMTPRWLIDFTISAAEIVLVLNPMTFWVLQAALEAIEDAVVALKARLLLASSPSATYAKMIPGWLTEFNDGTADLVLAFISGYAGHSGGSRGCGGSHGGKAGCGQQPWCNLCWGKVHLGGPDAPCTGAA